MENNNFFLKLDKGCISSITIKNDEYKMNWINDGKLWGEICHRGRNDNFFPSDKFILISFVEDEKGSETIFENSVLECRVSRAFTDEGNFRERYTFKNISSCDLLLRQGEIGIYTPFSDNYCEAEKSLRINCHTHINCGENITWINALRQGKSDLNIGLVLTHGSIDKYSLETGLEKNPVDSSCRGTFMLNPAPIDLLKGEEFVIEWEVFIHSGNSDFLNKISAKQPIRNLSATQYTIFSGESFEFSFETDEKNVEIVLDNEKLHFEKAGCIVTVKHSPQKFGDHKFIIFAGNFKTHINMFATLQMDSLIEKRIDFIVDNQQYEREGSNLNGAYLIYDNKTKRMVFDNRVHDHNACRERIGMALVITKYLQKNKNEKFYNSLMKFVEFVVREYFDSETGEVFNSVNKSRNIIRLYNPPWLMLFFAELYILTQDNKYVEFIMKSLDFYYANGGDRFYPISYNIKTIAYALEKSGNKAYFEKAIEYFKIHADNIIKNGLCYPAHEVVYEQSLPISAASIICDTALVTGEKKYVNAAKEHIEALERFDGMQPDCRLNQIPIRYWDDYWFGKSMQFGDTFPHYWSVLSADVWKDYHILINDNKYINMAHRCIRNCMCLFNDDGTASCAYLYPYYINNRPGEFYDEWANDQDFALYYLLKIIE